jgi:purine-binding chemotaxis protein CheW
MAGGARPRSSPAFPMRHPKQKEKVVATAMHQEPSAEKRHSGEGIGSMQLVSFRLAQEEFGIEITKVQEIILMGEITRIPQTPEYIKGLINLRSTVIPIVDLRLRFGLPSASATDETRIMVVNVMGKTIGMIVDAVSAVLRISPEQIAPPPPTVAGLGREYLTGLVKLDSRLLILLDIDRVLGWEETAAVASAAGRG